MTAEIVVVAAVALLLAGALLVIPVCRNRPLAGRVAARPGRPPSYATTGASASWMR